MPEPVRRDLGLRMLCDQAYRRYHRAEYVSPDPLQFVLQWDELRDREIVGFIASALAIGRVDGINRAVADVISRLRMVAPSPAVAVAALSPAERTEVCEGFRYRFFGEEQLSGLLQALGSVVGEAGSVELLFGRCLASSKPGPPETRLLESLSRMAELIRSAACGSLRESILVPDPTRGSACKRLLLFLRWMVRHDSVDPGGWTVISPADLLVPVDTHMLSIGSALGFSTRRQASWRGSVDLTRGFRRFAPDDPVRYDFSLTRLGIHPALTKETFLANCRRLSDGFPCGWKGATFGGKSSTHREEGIMQKYVCNVCGYIYDPAEGDPDNGVEPGTSFAEIPEDWVCPMCGALKEDFSPEE